MSSREKVVESVMGSRMGLAPMFMRNWAGRAYHQMMIATAQASGATTRPRKTHVLYPSAVLGGIKRWIEIHRQTANPRASLMRSPRVSWTDARVSRYGLLTSTVPDASAPRKSARSETARIRTPFELVGHSLP